MAVGFKTYGHEDKFWNLGPMPRAQQLRLTLSVTPGLLKLAQASGYFPRVQVDQPASERCGTPTDGHASQAATLARRYSNCHWQWPQYRGTEAAI